VAGKKTFVAGEILTASDVNAFLMNQAVQVYDDAAARDTALPSPLQGQLIYLKNDDVVQKFDGSDFLPVGGLVATKSVLKTDTFSASVTAGNEVAVTGLSITHAMQNANNKLIISAYFGSAASGQGFGRVGLSLFDDSTQIGAGESVGSRVRVTSGFQVSADASSRIGTSLSGSFVYEPGDTLSHTYSVRANNISTSTQTVYINRSDLDSNDATAMRGSSGLVIQEVAV
jgi:hypothetical protein